MVEQIRKKNLKDEQIQNRVAIKEKKDVEPSKGLELELYMEIIK